MEELMQNLHEAIEGCLSIEVAPPEPPLKTGLLRHLAKLAEISDDDL